jgi:hypothetical protein
VKKGIFILLLLPLTFACHDIDNCEVDPNLEVMIVRFFDLETKEAKKVGFVFTAENSPYQFVFAADTTVSSLGVTTIVSDSTYIALPLNPETELLTFYFNSDTSSHELVISYNKEFSIFDPDCEPSLTFTNLDTVRQTFDSTVVVNRLTNRQFDTNIKIYF